MSFLHAIILGLVEGITEFLPVSSTAHLLIASKILGIVGNHSFDIAVQVGAMFAIVAFYISQIKSLLRIVPKIIVGMVPALLAGSLIYPYLKDVLYENWLVIGLALAIGGIVMVLLEMHTPESDPQPIEGAAPDVTEISWRDSFLLGAFQAIAIIPGVSRSGATIIGGRLAKMDRSTIVQFSFLLGAPTILAASAYDIYKTGLTHEIASTSFLIAFVVSAVSAYFAVRWFVRLIERGTFTWFGWYRVAIGLLVLIFLA